MYQKRPTKAYRTAMELLYAPSAFDSALAPGRPILKALKSSKNSVAKCINKIPTEAQEQAAFFKWAKTYASLELMFHIPNGGSRSMSEGVRFKSMGVKRGVPDIFLPCRSDDGRWPGLWIEMKRIKGGVISPEQEIWHNMLRAHGWRVEVCKGCEEAIKVTQQYIGI